MARILMVVSGAGAMPLSDGTTHPTGYWAEEVAASHRLLRGAGFDVDIATPGGVQPTVDAASLEAGGAVSEAEAKEFRDYLDSIAGELAEPLPLAGVSAADYDAVYIPGGHGPMVDLAQDADLGRLLNEADGDRKVIAALCHGPAALLSATRKDGSFTFAGRTLTAFTDHEENQGLGDKTPYFLETVLRERGAVIDSGPAWASRVVVDGNLISGQNPQSSIDTANRVIAALKASGTE